MLWHFLKAAFDDWVGVEIVAEAPLLTAMWQIGEDSTNPQENHIVKPPFELFGKGASGGFLIIDNKRILVGRPLKTSPLVPF